MRRKAVGGKGDVSQTDNTQLQPPITRDVRTLMKDYINLKASRRQQNENNSLSTREAFSTPDI